MLYNCSSKTEYAKIIQCLNWDESGVRFINSILHQKRIGYIMYIESITGVQWGQENLNMEVPEISERNNIYQQSQTTVSFVLLF